MLHPIEIPCWFCSRTAFLPGYVLPKHSRVEEPNARRLEEANTRRRRRRRHGRRSQTQTRGHPLPKGHCYLPAACATGVVTTTTNGGDDDAIPWSTTLSAFMSCDCCGITHWPRDCPNRDQHLLLAPKTVHIYETKVDWMQLNRTQFQIKSWTLIPNIEHGNGSEHRLHWSNV